MSTVANPATASAASKLAKYQRRKFVNRVALVLSLAAMLFGLFWLAWILWETFRLGFSGLTFIALSH